MNENSIEKSSCKADPVALSDIVASVTGAHKMTITRARGSLHKEKLSVSQVERDVYHCFKSEQQSSRDSLWSQKETLAAVAWPRVSMNEYVPI